MTAALTDIEQDDDARTVERMYSKLYAHIETRINQGKTPAEVMEWFDNFYGWQMGTVIRDMTLNTARSLYRKQLELAREALEKASDTDE